MTLNMYDIVRVIAPIPSERVDASASRAKDVRVGDMGAIVMALAASEARTAYEVECVDPDGHTRWLATLFADEIERVAPVGAT
ncbi:hypothetical protein ASD77_04515 [Pseudoxanthomonas sp. Root65]|jgi:hypothetical protein|uniref:DUF4926 domain-containing protein n=1 Tax=Pseudoxanthomonas sp. Root65 TaxID=1736576 RepID=UPI0006F7CCC5|nr:DUF4926 domain-containing protein [Pseudoxanthomonas sp. Root65]KRA53909.1 hypothetical protein ASD77_04515 [Pseudoxanthomonas sp. Root65]